MAGWGTGETENGRGVGAVNVFVTPARNEKSGAGGENNVVRQQRSPFEPRAAIEREVVARLVREQHELSRFGRDGANVVHVDEAFQLRQNIGVETVSEDERARIDEVRLAFGFARPEIDHQTISLFKVNRGAGEIESLVREKTEWTAD